MYPKSKRSLQSKPITYSQLASKLLLRFLIQTHLQEQFQAMVTLQEVVSISQHTSFRHTWNRSAHRRTSCTFSPQMCWSVCWSVWKWHSSRWGSFLRRGRGSGWTWSGWISDRRFVSWSNRHFTLVMWFLPFSEMWETVLFQCGDNLLMKFVCHSNWIIWSWPAHIQFLILTEKGQGKVSNIWHTKLKTYFLYLYMEWYGMVSRYLPELKMPRLYFLYLISLNGINKNERIYALL